MGGRACAAAGAVAAHHLLLDRVDLVLDRHVGGRTVGVRAGIRVEVGRGVERHRGIGAQAFAADLAQHVELALAHEIVAPLALDHGLDFRLGVLALACIGLLRFQR